MSKKALSEKINEILGTKIDFTKLSQKDLETLVKLLSNLAQVAQIGVKSARDKLKGSLLQRPTGEVLRMPVIDVIRQARGEGGLVGMLDRVMRERTSTRRK